VLVATTKIDPKRLKFMRRSGGGSEYYIKKYNTYYYINIKTTPERNLLY